MRVIGGVMMIPMATRCVHAWNTLEERWARYRFVQHAHFAGHALEAR